MKTKTLLITAKKKMITGKEISGTEVFMWKNFKNGKVQEMFV